MKIKSNSLEKILTYIGLAVLSFGAVFFRLYELGAQSFWMDEGYTVNAVLSVIARGKTILDSGQYYSCATYCYPSSWFVRIFGEANPASYRALAAIAGIAFIVAIFFIVKKWLGSKVAILATLFMAFSYWQIAWSREARWYTLLELFFWLALFFFWQLLKIKNNFRLSAVYFLLAIIFTTLAIITHAEAYLLLPIFGIVSAYTIWNKSNQKINHKILTISCVVLLIIISALTLDRLGLHYLKPLFASLSLHYSLPYYLNFYLRNYWFFIIPAVWLFFNLKNNLNSSIYYFLLFIFISYLLTFGLFSDLVHYRYLFLVTPTLYIFGTSGIINLLEKVRHKLWRVVSFCLLIFIFFISGHGVFWPKNFYTLESDNPSVIKGRPYYAYTPQSNFNEAYNYVKEKKSSEEIVISSHPAFNKIYLQEPGYWLEYRYLGINDKNSYISPDNREYYVGAEVIGNRKELQEIARGNHGYIIFDYYSTQNRIPENEIQYIRENFELVFQNKTNSYSDIWVYKF